MPNYKMTLAYDGSRYSGWQKQGNTDNTIQGRLESILSKLSKETVTVNGSGRTDAGVHAQGQVASFVCRARRQDGTFLSPEELLTLINQALPQDIRVTALSEAAPRFHARLNASAKHYRYQIDNGPVARVFDRKYVTRLTAHYDIDAMQKAALLLQGEHDFKSFCENKHMKKSTIRTIDLIQITSQGGLIQMDFHGNGFLYHMVRILAGTLLEVGEGKRTPESVTQVLAAKSRPAAGFTAPAQGLFLMDVTY